MSLIFIVIRDTYSSNALQNDIANNVVDENNLNTSNTNTNKRPSKRTQAEKTKKRELNKLKEYVLTPYEYILTLLFFVSPINFLFFSFFFGYKFHRESNLLKRIFQCCLLNGGIFGLSIILFECVLLPIIQMFLSWMFTRHPGNGAVIGNYIVTFLSILFGMIWVMPLFILSKVVNSLWFQVSKQNNNYDL